MQTEKITLEFDLDLEAQPTKGELSFDKSSLKRTLNGISEQIDAADIKAVEVKSNIGCGYIRVEKTDGSDVVFARMTLSQIKEADEFSKAVSFALSGGELLMPESQKRICPKCGKPIPETSEQCVFCIKKSSVFKRALTELKPFYAACIIGGLFLVLCDVLYAVVPQLNQYLVDDYLTVKRDLPRDIILIAGAILLTRGLSELMFIISARFYTKIGARYANLLRQKAFSNIQALSLSSMSKKTAGDLIKRVTQDTQTVRDFISSQGRWIIELVVIFIVACTVMLSTSPLLTLLVFLPVPIALFISSKVWKIINLKYERQWKLNSRSNSVLHDIIKGIRVVKTFGNEKREVEKYGKTCHDYAVVAAKNEQFYSVFFPLITFLIGIGEFFVLYFAGEMVMGEQLSLGELVKFNIYMTMLYGPLRWLSSIPRSLAETTTSLVKLFEIIDEKPEPDRSVAGANVDYGGDIAFSNVTFGYKAYEPVLKNISFTVKSGEMIGIVGHSGVGKSTLINLLLKMYEVNRGDITIGGVSLADIPADKLRENIGAVFQDTFLFAGTILDNIAYSRPDASPEEIISAAKIANAHQFIMKLPDGYSTLIGENGYTLSGGERQRLSIARAVLKNPKILILDEATASLDPETESKIQEALLNITQNRTTLAIAHRLSTLRKADKLLVLDKGEVKEFGTHRELLAQKGIYYELVMAQRQTNKIKKEQQ